MIRYLLLAAFGCYTVMCSCTRTESDTGTPVRDTAIVNTLIRQAEIVGQSGNDSMVAPQLRALYKRLPSQYHDVIFPAMVKRLNKVLIINPHTDTGIVPFYKGLASDNSLGKQNRANACISMANYHAFVSFNDDTAAWYLHQADKYPEVVNDTMREKWYGVCAQVYRLRADLKNATACIYKSIELNDRMNNSGANIANYINLSNIYSDMNEYSKAIRMRKQALENAIATHDERAMLGIMPGLASAYDDLGQYDSSKKFYADAEALIAKGVRDPMMAYYLYVNKAGMYITLRDLDSALLYFDKAKELLPLFNNPTLHIFFTVASAIAYSNIRNVSKEAKMVEAYIPQLMAAGDLQTVTEAYYGLYNISLKQKIGRTSIEYYKLYDSVKTILVNNENRDFVSDMESRYLSREKNLRIRVQQKEIAQKNTLILALVISLFAVALLTAIFIITLRLRRSRRETGMQHQFTRRLLKNTEEERARIAGELHDGISHELLTLKNNLHLDVTAARQQVADIINNIRMISRNLHPFMLDKVGLKYSIEHLCEQITAGDQLFASATVDYDKQLIAEDELQLYRIIQESLSNVIKHAAAVAAKVEIYPLADVLMVMVRDNGKGFDVDEMLASGNAFGLNNILERSRAIGGKAAISSAEQGTIIHIEIPVQRANNHHR